MANKKSEEYMLLFYKKEEDRLYGFIRFCRQERPGQKTFSKPYRESDPFVIGRYAADGQVEVLGSVVSPLLELRRIVVSFIAANNQWHRDSVAGGAPVKRSDDVYRNAVMDHMVLASVHARNVMDIFPRLRTWTIARSGYDNKPDGGHLELRQVFDVLIHNRYGYFDGSHVRDLLSDRQTPTGRFMGYGFDISDFFRAVLRLVEDVTVRDWTKYLRQRTKHLSAKSEPHRIIPVVQNVEALSSILRSREDMREDYHQLLSHWAFQDRRQALPLDAPTVLLRLALQDPQLKIAADLSKKELELSVKRSIGLAGRDEELEAYRTPIGLDDFLGRLDKALGDRSLVRGIYDFGVVEFS